MCGIAGFTTTVGDAIARQTVSRMVQTLAHRGPDGSGVWAAPAQHDGRLITLGHSRLAILDLSEGARQPFHGQLGTVSTGLTIVFNGEIYNYLELRAELTAKGHAFRTGSDTEVLLTAYAVWGADCLVRLRGMYA